MHALPSFLVHWYVLLCILSYRFVVSFSTFSTFVCTSTLRQFFCPQEVLSAGVPHRGAALPFETGLRMCHRAGLTVLQRFFLGFGCGSVIVCTPTTLDSLMFAKAGHKNTATELGTAVTHCRQDRANR